MKRAARAVIGFLKSRSSEFWLVSLLLVIAGFAAAWNMFNFPYFENDEATYVSQAWSFIHEGRLAPYTYTYDHAPAGWMFIGVWLLLTGGLHTFGDNPLISGRIFIFILHMLSVLMLYVIAKRVSHNKLAGYLAVIVFALSPLEIYFGRRILLDNIMIFWLLLSLLLATTKPLKLRFVIGSAVAFGISVLTKENALFVAPVLLYIIAIYSVPRIRIWSVMKWLSASIAVIALYPLYALLHGELFPPSPNGPSHVSLIGTTLLQNSRGALRLPWDPSSDFFVNLMEWIQRDPIIIFAGAFCILATLVLSNRYKESKAIALTAIAGLIFLARGKLVIDFYILALLPLLAIVIGDLLAKPVTWAKEHVSPRGYGMVATLILVVVFVASGTSAFTKNETSNQEKAVAWIAQNVPKTDSVIIDNYAYPQLHDDLGYKNADFAFKVQYDPAIKDTKYHNSIDNFDYLLITHEEIVQMQSGQLPLLEQAFKRSELVADFRDGTSSYIDTKKLISTNGDWAQVYKVLPANAPVEQTSWLAYKQGYITDNGQVVDPVANDTTSEGQSYAMLRAIKMNDRVAFDNVWKWTKSNLQHDDALFSWKVVIDKDGKNQLYDKNSSSDADQDIAVALLQAQTKWGGSYNTEAKKIITSIWEKEVIQKNNMYYLTSAEAGAVTNDLILVNPSYISPASYKLFATVDTIHPWAKLTDDSYAMLASLQARSTAGLFPNWIAVDNNGGFNDPSSFNVTAPNTYGYDAFRVGWRMASDSSDARAQSILRKLTDFYDSQLTSNGYLASEYSMDGSPQTHFSDVAPSAGAYIAMKADGDANASKLYDTDIKARYHSNGSYWGQSYNYYSQNWGAFATLW